MKENKNTLMEEKIILENEGLIRSIAKRFYGVDVEDLCQAGRMGLIKAYKNYIVNDKAKLSTYAFMSIYGEMLKFVKKSKAIKVNRNIEKIAKKINQTKSELAQTYGRIPTNIELSEFLGMELKIIEEALQAEIYVTSLEGETQGERSIHETIACEENMTIDEKIMIKDAVNHLEEPKRSIIKERYFKNKTQTEVAEKLNLTQAMVSRYEKQSLSLMRTFIA